MAQVFISDESWLENLIGIRKNLKPNGYLIFEVRDPSRKAWLDWNRDKTYQKQNIKIQGEVEAWCDLLDISKGLVSFRWSYIFKSDGQKITSDSTLRFREKDEIIESLNNTGFKVKDIRDAPDRPGKEFVFIAYLKS